MKPISVVLLLLLAAGPRMASAQDVTDASEDATGTETSATAEASGAETSDTDDSDDSEESDEQSAEAAPVVAAPAAAVEPAEAEEPAAESAGELGQREQLEADLAGAQAEAAGEEAEAAASLAIASNPNPDAGPWGASFGWNQTVSAYTLNPEAQLTYNPTYSWTFTLAPTYVLSDYDLIFGVSTSITVELTDSDATATRRELWTNDTSVTATYMGLGKVGGFSLTPTVALILPTSRSSIAATRLVGTNVALAASRSFGDFSLSASGSFSHWFARQNVAVTDTDYGCHIVDPSGNVDPICNQIPGYSTTRDTIVGTLGLGYKATDELSLSTSFSAIWSLGHPLAEACFNTLGSDSPTCLEDNSATHLRGLTSFTLGAAYGLTDYLSAVLSMATTSPHLDTNASLENPIFNERTVFSLSATLDIDALYRSAGAEDSSSADADSLNNNVSTAATPAAARW